MYPSDPDAEAITLAVTGSGGNGAVTAGLILLAAAGHAGYYGLLRRSAGPQIRGGESAALLTLGAVPVRAPGERFDLLAAIDWGNFERFDDELPLAPRALVLADPAAGPPPPALLASIEDLWLLPLAEDAASRPGGRANLVAVGVVGALLGLPLVSLHAGAELTLAAHGPELTATALACLAAGHALGSARAGAVALPPPRRTGPCWNISGNEAAGLGALRGGVRFVAAYPITPATDLLEWLSPRLEATGGALLQAEDELAAIHMAIGAAWGGVPALTATAGPGLALMVEGLGLAVASETPVVVVDVQRVGPSTGIATKSEQADLNLALYGLHGDAPHLVLAPLGIGDCALTVEWATGLAETLQTAAIVLSDQALGQTRGLIDPPPRAPASPGRRVATVGPGPWQRYAASADGVSPMALPGTPGLMYTADGLEHDAAGHPSSRAAVHAAQLDKRWRKLAGYPFGPAWADIDGAPAALCLVTWGACHGAVLDAADRLRAQRLAVRVIGLRLLAPLPVADLRAAIGTAAVLVVEQNQHGQLFAHLHAQRVLPPDARVLARPGPLPIGPRAIVAAALSCGDPPCNPN